MSKIHQYFTYLLIDKFLNNSIIRLFKQYFIRKTYNTSIFKMVWYTFYKGNYD